MLPGSCPRQQLLPVQRREESDGDTGRRKHSREARHATRDTFVSLRRTDLSRGAASPGASLGRERPRASSPEVEEKSRHRGKVYAGSSLLLLLLCLIFSDPKLLLLHTSSHLLTLSSLYLPYSSYLILS